MEACHYLPNTNVDDVTNALKMANKRLNGEGSIVFHKSRGMWVMALTIGNKYLP